MKKVMSKVNKVNLPLHLKVRLCHHPTGLNNLSIEVINDLSRLSLHIMNIGKAIIRL